MGHLAKENGDVRALPKPEAVSTMLYVDGNMWFGCAKGYVAVIDAESMDAVAQMSAHTDKVTCMAKSGNIVWTGSGDKNIIAWDRERYIMLYSVGNQGGYLVSMATTGWKLWSASSKGLRCYTVEGNFEFRKEKIKRLANEVARLEGVEADLRQQLANALRHGEDLANQLAAANRDNVTLTHDVQSKQVALDEALRNLTELREQLEQLQGGHSGLKEQNESLLESVSVLKQSL